MWLLDFDGVVNALGRRGGHAFWDDWEQAQMDHPLGLLTRDYQPVRLPLLWSRTVVRVIAEAVDAGVDVRWLTTWREHTRLLSAVIPGLPDMPWLDEEVLDPVVADELAPEEAMSSGRWKVECAKAYVPEEARLLWTDDAEWLTTGDNADWLRRRRGPVEAISPAPSAGLIPRDVRRIREWLGAVG